MTARIGTPDFLTDRAYLKLMYSKLLVQKTDFFQNIQYGVLFNRKRQESALVSPAEESKWLHFLLDERNVGYSEAANKVVIPELMLRPPFFHPGYPNAANLGGLGVRIAEAVIEGVVGYGLLFDADGYLQFPPSKVENSNSSSANFVAGDFLQRPLKAWERSTKCLSRAYSELGVDTPDFLRKCRRKSALDVSALKQTFVSLEDMLELEKGVLLPAMETSDPQSVFFLSYAQSLCSKRTIQQRDMDRTVGKSLLDEESLKGVLSQMPQFRHYYFCPSNDADAYECQTVV